MSLPEYEGMQYKNNPYKPLIYKGSEPPLIYRNDALIVSGLTEYEKQQEKSARHFKRLEQMLAIFITLLVIGMLSLFIFVPPKEYRKPTLEELRSEVNHSLPLGCYATVPKTYRDAYRQEPLEWEVVCETVPESP